MVRHGAAPVALGMLLCGWSVQLAGSAHAASGTGVLYVVQGIAGTTASVTVDGRKVADGVEAKTVVGPLDVEPGTHTVQLWRGGDAVAQAWFRARAGSSTDLVAHRFPDAERAPAFTTYTNDTSATPAGKSRLLVAHTAVAPPTDVVVNGRVLIRNLANGEFATNVVPAGKYDVSVVPTATSGPPILGPSTLNVGPGKLVNVFAIGDSSTGRMDAVVQVLPIATTASTKPSRVDTGDGGQAAALFAVNRPGSAPVLDLIGAAGLSAGLLLAASRSRAARARTVRQRRRTAA